MSKAEPSSLIVPVFGLYEYVSVLLPFLSFVMVYFAPFISKVFTYLGEVKLSVPLFGS